MEHKYKTLFKSLSRKNWFLYRLSSVALNLYGKMRGGIKITKYHCVRLNKFVLGKGNSFKSDEGCVIDRLNLHIVGNDNIIEIGKNCTIQKACDFWIMGNNCKLTIGDGSRLGANCAIEIQEDGQHITIGNDNMWSHNVRLRNNDSHYIYDITTGFRTNPPKHIEIGDHVWIAAFATVLKGVKIGSGSVVGTHALVTKDVPDNVIVGGVPAKVLQNGIEWSDSLR